MLNLVTVSETATNDRKNENIYATVDHDDLKEFSNSFFFSVSRFKI